MERDSRSKKYAHPRRVNGLQFPLNYLQLLGWIIFIVTALLNFFIVVEVQIDPLKILFLVVYIILYISHIVTHILAMVLDPAEEEIRQRETNEVPEFDRNLHAHVIENGRCHLCNIYTSDKKTKHCGICNKCVYRFDHHCKWLNNCVGDRNYSAFIGCVSTALLISVLTFSICVVDIVMFFENSEHFSDDTRSFINCTAFEGNTQGCRNSALFIFFLISYMMCSIAILCALLHLLCFHIYISFRGISTYEYIISSRRSPLNMQCFRMPTICVLKARNKHRDVVKSEPNVANLVKIIINYELEKAKKMFYYDRNKIYPAENNSPD